MLSLFSLWFALSHSRKTANKCRNVAIDRSTFSCLLPETDPINVEQQLKAIKIYNRTVDLEIIRNPAIFTTPESYGSLAAVSKANLYAN